MSTRARRGAGSTVTTSTASLEKPAVGMLKWTLGRLEVVIDRSVYTDGSTVENVEGVRGREG